MTGTRAAPLRSAGIVVLIASLIGCQASNPSVADPGIARPDASACVDAGAPSTVDGQPSANADAGRQSDPAIVALFDAYAKAMNEHALGRSVALYAPQFILADPKGSRVIVNDAQRRAAVDQENAYYRDTLGMTSASATVVSEIPMKDHHVFVRTVWHCTFKKTGDRVIDFPLSFIVEQIAPNPPKIIVHVVEEDEPQMFRDLGLL